MVAILGLDFQFGFFGLEFQVWQGLFCHQKWSRD